LCQHLRVIEYAKFSVVV